MRKNNIFYMFCAFLSLFFCNASFAGVSIGVPLTEDASCNFALIGANYNSDWSTTCTLSGYPSVTVSGIGICSDNNGEVGEVYDGQLKIVGAECCYQSFLNGSQTERMKRNPTVIVFAHIDVQVRYTLFLP